MSSGKNTPDFEPVRMDDLRSTSNTTVVSNVPHDYLDYIRLLQENKKLESSYLLSMGIACHDSKFRRRLSDLVKLEDTLRKTMSEKCELLKSVHKCSLDYERLDQIRMDLERKVCSLQKICQTQEQYIDDLKKTLDKRQNEIKEHTEIAQLIHDLSDSYLNKK